MQYLGSDNEHNVYTAEVAAFRLAADIASNSQPFFTKCIIYADSQAAIRGVNSPNQQSGQEVLISTIHKIQSLVTTRNMTIKIEWVPGHENIHGNEEADKAAKAAAQSKGNDIKRYQYPPLYLSTPQISKISQHKTRNYRRMGSRMAITVPTRC